MLNTEISFYKQNNRKQGTVKKGCISILNKAKNLSLLENREQGTRNRESGIRKKYFCKYEMYPKKRKTQLNARFK